MSDPQTKPERMTERPWWCLDPECRTVMNTPGSHSKDPGASGFCCGILPEQRVIVRGNIEHKNDLKECSKTPMKGIIQYEVNAWDLRLEIKVMLAVLVELGETTFNPTWYLERDSWGDS